MTAKEFYSALLGSLKAREDITIRKYRIKYLKSQYDFLRIASKKIGLEDKVVMIRAGIHGNEIAGPLTILSFCNLIIEYIHRAGLKCIIYPLGNPSGFEMGTRYNEDDNGRDIINNDFLWYELEDGEIVDDIGKSDEFKKWYWSSDPKLKIDHPKLKIRPPLPAETELMHRLLKKDPLSQIVACIDLHQDCISNFTPAAYHYAFGDLSRYQSIVEEIGMIVPVLCNTDVGAGEDSPAKSDGSGFIIRHDGVLPDLMFRLGAEHCITAEISCATPIRKARIVNMFWIFGIVDLVRGGD
ncbi:MAG: succinylglutamate desuccinylase/aspartoacylase family protein [Candidatus Nealsonbacteria bacterium]|nr:succinylglutamate desuccinylase/aspartoacylase family protein [Candidatus Nealsonbacteria bacterium]